MKSRSRPLTQQQSMPSPRHLSAQSSSNAEALAQMRDVRAEEEEGGFLDGLSTEGFGPGLEMALTEAFGEDVSGLGVGRASAQEADRLSARAFCEGSEMSFGPDVDLGAVQDARSMATVAHEVSHALAPSASPEHEVDQAGDPGEVLADRAGLAFGTWMASGMRGAAPKLAAATGGRARIQRESDDRAVKTTEPHHNRRGDESPKRWEDDKLQFPARGARRELAAEIVGEDGSYAPFGFSDPADFESIYKHYSEYGDCALACYATLEKMGYEEPRGDKHSVLKRGEIGASVGGNVTDVDPEGAMKMLDTIDLALADGKPVMLGVAYECQQHAANGDGVTDHWLILTNRTYDPVTGEVQYEAIDNASDQASHRVFTVGEDYALRSAPPPEAGPLSGIGQLPYTATNARVPERKP